MNPLLLTPLLDFGKAILDRFIPDPAQKQAAELEMFRMAADGELKEVLGQLEINVQEAANPSVFVSGWRPFIGWVCGSALVYQYLLRPLAGVFFLSIGHPLPMDLPGLDDNLWQLLLGMLGLGGLRTFEKVKGVTK